MYFLSRGLELSLLLRHVYLSTFIAASQHGAMLPVVEVQSFLCEWLVLFSTEYTQAERSDQTQGQLIFLQRLNLHQRALALTVTLMERQNNAKSKEKNNRKPNQKSKLGLRHFGAFQCWMCFKVMHLIMSLSLVKIVDGLLCFIAFCLHIQGPFCSSWKLKKTESLKSFSTVQQA